MSRDVAYRNGYLPLYAGAELVRRSGSLTQFPADNLIGTLPPPPICPTSPVSFLRNLEFGEGVGIVNNPNFVTAINGGSGGSTYDQIWVPGVHFPANFPVNRSFGITHAVVPKANGFGNTSEAALYPTGDPFVIASDECMFRMRVSGGWMTNASDVISQAFFNVFLGGDPESGTDAYFSNGVSFDWTQEGNTLRASMAVGRNLAPGLPQVELRSNGTGNVTMDSPIGAFDVVLDIGAGVTTLSLEISGGPTVSTIVEMSPRLAGAMIQRFYMNNTGSSSALLQTGLYHIANNAGIF